MPLRGHYQEGNEVNDNGMPQGFLVTQPPGSVTPAHFHEPNQFQVFVDGSGRIGARAGAAFERAVRQRPHALWPHRGRAPKASAISRCASSWDPGAKYVPAALAKMRKGGQRTRMASGLARRRRSRAQGAHRRDDRNRVRARGGWPGGFMYRAGANQMRARACPTRARAADNTYWWRAARSSTTATSCPSGRPFSCRSAMPAVAASGRRRPRSARPAVSAASRQ